MDAMPNIGGVAKRLGVSVKTVQRWDREGRFVPAARSAGGCRMDSESQLARQLGDEVQTRQTRVIAYCRVSSAAQKPDLRNQRRTLEQFVVARGLANVEFIEEVGGGLNFKRRKLLELTDAITRREVGILVLAHRDRLTRFGFEWFEHLAHMHGCEVLVLNQEHLSPEQEMVRDMMSIVHCFSSRLHGLRSYRRQLDAALKQDTAHAAGSSYPA
jgi:predicted site-specific integrase-resolvase